MVFTPPPWVPELPAIPDSIPIEEFYTNEAHGRKPFAESRPPYICGLTGKSYTAAEVRERTGALARGLAARLGFAPNEGLEWDKVVCLYSANTIDYIPTCHAVHRLSGIVTPASAAYSADELAHQLRSTDSKAVVTCVRLLETALKAARACNIPDTHVFLLEMAGDPAGAGDGFATINQIISEGRKLPPLEPLRWTKGQGQRQVAFLSYSSGTSGLPKAVMVSHTNVIGNCLQFTTYDSVAHKTLGVGTQAVLGLLPFSHIYALVAVTHACTSRGDSIIVLPSFDLHTYLAATQKYRIDLHFVVPPVVVQLIHNADICAKYDLSAIRLIITAAAPLGHEVTELLQAMLPTACIGQAYGMTETATVALYSNEIDIAKGSSGSIVPGNKMKIMGADGNEITTHDTPGELWVQGPSVVLGYLNNVKADAETFVWDDDGRWIKTGDEVVVRRSPKGDEVFYIVDRIKELIKVKGHQVAPAELETHLLTHPDVADCAVIPIPDEYAGEVPKAYVVRAAATVSKPDAEVAASICAYVEEHKARHKRLKGGVRFVDVIPKGASGKILRRLLRDREKEERAAGRISKL